MWLFPVTSKLANYQLLFLSFNCFSTAQMRAQSCLFSSAAAIPEGCECLVATVNSRYLQAAVLCSKRCCVMLKTSIFQTMKWSFHKIKYCHTFLHYNINSIIKWVTADVTSLEMWLTFCSSWRVQEIIFFLLSSLSKCIILKWKSCPSDLRKPYPRLKKLPPTSVVALPVVAIKVRWRSQPIQPVVLLPQSDNG